VACVRLAQPRLDTTLARDADDALGKLLAVLTAAARAAAESLAVYAPVIASDDANRERLRVLREATEARRFVQLDYESLQGAASQRRVRRQDFRSFRVDRIRTLQTLPEAFRDESGKTLADLLRIVRAR